MPKALEKKLKAEARKKGLKGKRARAYTFGTMRKQGWKPSRELHRSQRPSKTATSAQPSL